jgi:hypothetical protein
MGEVESEGQRLANEWADECLTADAALAIDAALRRAKAEAKAEGLRQAKQYVERKIQIGADFIGGPDPNVQRRVALLEVIEYCDKRIATLLDARDVRSGIRASRTHGLERGGRAHE